MKILLLLAIVATTLAVGVSAASYSKSRHTTVDAKYNSHVRTSTQPPTPPSSWRLPNATRDRRHNMLTCACAFVCDCFLLVCSNWACTRPELCVWPATLWRTAPVS